MKDTLTFEDATRLCGPRAFNLMIKPAGSLCNLDCRYCYYLDKSGIYGGNSVIEHNGDVYCCDHFVYPKYKLGNIITDDLSSMMDSPQQTSFGIGKRNDLPRACLRCQWLKACHGECPKHRFNESENGETNLNVLCDGLRLFFSHVAPYMDHMASCLENNTPPGRYPR